MVVPHPIRDDIQQNSNIKNDCVGLCNSNSEKFIDEMCEVFKNDDKYKIILRSKKQKFSSGSVKIISGFLDAEVYYNYINTSKTVIVPVPNSYKYRLSGSIYDALSRRKIVLTNNSFYADAYNKLYSGTCIFVSNAKDVKSYFENNESEGKNIDSSFKKFIYDHQKTSIAIRMEKVIKETMEEKNDYN